MTKSVRMDFQEMQLCNFLFIIFTEKIYVVELSNSHSNRFNSRKIFTLFVLPLCIACSANERQPLSASDDSESKRSKYDC